ncbi:hypothetical protein [Acholeplasma laidlawii]|uniref:Cellobiose phosphorylase n=1 Tax=Acholeplasma laidlawii (strain PG-8A) TaxID=441768 RepID=A9NG52_ACHLI|nr:hypothetical protein [Acholeplasma laidlawii]ABX81332.1 hypothetical protein ACL_0716 [Acholeplasma laidlawii PG-8A]RED20422.1 hypothetical protein C7385_0650 [Acholeplasma laidlawii]SQH56933.1 Uncharacterised protein [Acholeplasma laidlawii]
MTYFNEETKEFIFENYHKLKPFASFLPGIAGKNGVPMWTYYVNRGQLIASFGIENKDHAILDFTPANLSYRNTSVNGFRTFLKVNDQCFEPFGTTDSNRKLFIGRNKVSIEETNNDVQTTVKYFHVTEKKYPGLVRKVQFKALKDMKLSFIDGLATFWPYGTGLYAQKNMSNLAVAWFDVFNQENHIPFMKNRSTTEDTEEISALEAGNFYVSVDQHHKRLKPIYDSSIIFGYQNELAVPHVFNQMPYDEFIRQNQASTNQLLSGFSTHEVHLRKDETYTFYTLLGSYSNLDSLNESARHWDFNYFESLEALSESFIEELVAPMDTQTNYPLFDQYMKQSFLDNLLRGGFPYIFKGLNKDHVYHTYSRIHGDMEREYNNFYIEPRYYSHGNGSYRDVNQNRRNDVYFVKEAGIFNIVQFLELIQLDGHNPLTIEGSRFTFNQKYQNKLLEHVVKGENKLIDYLKKPFTPGSLLMFIENNIETNISPQTLLDLIMYYTDQTTQSSFGTGYWSDHWIYNLDLIEQYLAIFPDKIDFMLFDQPIKFYQSKMSVYPRKYKYVLNKEGFPRQLGGLYEDKEKVKSLDLKQGSNFHKFTNGKTVSVNLYSKLLHLATIKTASLDPMGMGVMMDSEKPGWNDAMNGLPAIFGSGTTETINLARLFKYLIEFSHLFKSKTVSIQSDIYDFFTNLTHHIDDGFDKIQDIRESFDAKTNLYLSDAFVDITIAQLIPLIERLNDYIHRGIKNAFELGKGLIPTYLTFEATTYQKNGLRHPHLNLECIDVTNWKVRPLPHYLEAPAHYLKSMLNVIDAHSVHQHVKASGIYDETLGVYKTSASLEDETLEIGRARAFTKGWLERESSFVHMSYKYLIGMFKSGLYDEFYKDIKTSMPPFMDPLVYGRSTLENVSFIATSNNPNPKVHGQGFVARLTGTTSEAMTLMYLMFLGKQPFSYKENKLTFKVNPKVIKDFFKEGRLSFKFLSHITITIHNPHHVDTFNLNVTHYTLSNQNERIKIQGDSILGEHADDIRNLKYSHIDAYLG